MKELKVNELREVNGGGLATVGIVLLCIGGAALGFYNGKKDTDLKYENN